MNEIATKSPNAYFFFFANFQTYTRNTRYCSLSHVGIDLTKRELKRDSVTRAEIMIYACRETLSKRIRMKRSSIRIHIEIKQIAFDVCVIIVVGFSSNTNILTLWWRGSFQECHQLPTDNSHWRRRPETRVRSGSRNASTVDYQQNY